MAKATDLLVTASGRFINVWFNVGVVQTALKPLEQHVNKFTFPIGSLVFSSEDNDERVFLHDVRTEVTDTVMTARAVYESTSHPVSAEAKKACEDDVRTTMLGPWLEIAKLLDKPRDKKPPESKPVPAPQPTPTPTPQQPPAGGGGGNRPPTPPTPEQRPPRGGGGQHGGSGGQQ